MSAQKCSLVISASAGGFDWPPGWAAALTRMSMRPKAECTAATIRFTSSSWPVSALKADDATAGLVRETGGGGIGRGHVAGDDRHVGAFTRELARNRLADAAAAAGHDGGLACELEIHDCLPRLVRSFFRQHSVAGRGEASGGGQCQDQE